MRDTDRVYVRTDWGLVRLFYVPAVFLLVAALMFIPALAAIKFRFAIGCGVCWSLKHWGHRSEEWLNAKPLLEITAEGVAHEDGGDRVIYKFADIDGIALQRRKAPWLTNGHSNFNPPIWLTLRIRNPQISVDTKGFFKSEPAKHLFIDVWPREVVGGLLHLRRFAGTLQKHVSGETKVIAK